MSFIKTGYKDKKPHHKSGCWSCKGEIDDSEQYRCIECNWVICSECYACKPTCNLCHQHDDWVGSYPITNKQKDKHIDIYKEDD